MTLTPGSRLGPYEIIVPIGSGGMGEIYKARDTRLDRVVAVKVISPLFAGAPELRDPFEREARAVSQLNHPNICTLPTSGTSREPIISCWSFSTANRWLTGCRRDRSRWNRPRPSRSRSATGSTGRIGPASCTAI